MTIPMHYITEGIAIWICVAGIAILFIRGATSRPSSREERRIKHMGEA